MVFSSMTFLVVFLPSLIACYFAVPDRYVMARKYILLIFSIIFYSAGEPLYIFVIAVCVVGTWLLSYRIENGCFACLTVALVLNLLPLVFFKYTAFIVENVMTLAEIDKFLVPSISLPVGISFYTFQTISYAVDLYKGRIKRQRNIGLFALYIFFFPQLVAGPVVRYADIEEELINSRETWGGICSGCRRFIIGLSKKVLIANQVGFIADTISNSDAYSLTTGIAWLGVFAFTMQIYFDFSGYSDMAIGLGRIFGFTFPENFNHPYACHSVTDFWRRWNISVGSFFRDYVYIPLGGNRCRLRCWFRNVLVVWLLTGLWHGASWNFVFWGLYYGVLLILEKLFLGRVLRQLPRFISWVFVFFLIMIGWAMFMCDGYTASEMGMFISRLFWGGAAENCVNVVSMGLMGYLPYLVPAFIFSFPLSAVWEKLYERLEKKVVMRVFDFAHDAVLIGMLLLSIVFIVGGSYNPFIYYRF